MSVQWAAQMSKIEKEMVDNKVELQIADEVKLTIEAREAREDDDVMDIVEEMCLAFGGGDIETIFNIVKEDQES